MDFYAIRAGKVIDEYPFPQNYDEVNLQKMTVVANGKEYPMDMIDNCLYNHPKKNKPFNVMFKYDDIEMYSLISVDVLNS